MGWLLWFMAMAWMLAVLHKLNELDKMKSDCRCHRLKDTVGDVIRDEHKHTH